MTRAFAVAAALLLASARAYGQAAPPAPHEDAAFDFMNLLSDHGLHNLNDEDWNVYGQFTYITSFKVPFSAPYTNANGAPNSFSPDYERSFTGTFTLFFGVKLWKGAEAYVAPEVIAEHALSQLRGLGGATENFELQKTGTTTPAVYRSRLFLRQTFDLGGTTSIRVSDPLQLGGPVDSRRLVITAGNFSVIDVFDKNNVTWDPRQTFFDEAFMTHSSYDFPADARGYTYGVAAELYWDDWAVRLGRFLPPVEPNQQSNDFHFWERYGDSLEIEHDHTLLGQPGAVRLLGYRNHVLSGRFDDAIAAFEADPSKNAGDCPAGSYNYGSGDFNAPDLCWVRKPNVKLGIGLNAEQYVAKNVGLFLRAMYSDGQSEVDAFDSADSDLSFGAVAKGTLWGRPFDVTGIGMQVTAISKEHARYLAVGGIDNFVGDGALGRQRAEGVAEAFYSVNIAKAVWLAADFQLIWNPAYNGDRPGPIYIPAVKVHGEF
ncbi:MAG TPA: carbohydrate porin [Kofleriaceae bacterium]|nr:carbohydrate porin [Kofleriaceae bacterium]